MEKIGFGRRLPGIQFIYPLPRNFLGIHCQIPLENVFNRRSSPGFWFLITPPPPPAIFFTLPSGFSMTFLHPSPGFSSVLTTHSVRIINAICLIIRKDLVCQSILLNLIPAGIKVQISATSLTQSGLLLTMFLFSVVFS